MLILGCNYLEKKNSNMNSGIQVVNDLLFYEKKTNLLRQLLVINKCKPNSL